MGCVVGPAPSAILGTRSSDSMMVWASECVGGDKTVRRESYINTKAVWGGRENYGDHVYHTLSLG